MIRQGPRGLSNLESGLIHPDFDNAEPDHHTSTPFHTEPCSVEVKIMAGASVYNRTIEVHITVHAFVSFYLNT